MNAKIRKKNDFLALYFKKKEKLVFDALGRMRSMLSYVPRRSWAHAEHAYFIFYDY